MGRPQQATLSATTGIDLAAPAASLALQFAALLGVHDCEIEAGPVGLVIYGASPERTFTAARKIATFLRAHASKDPRIEAPVFDDDEADNTSWIATVRFSW